MVHKVNHFVLKVNIPTQLRRNSFYLVYCYRNKRMYYYLQLTYDTKSKLKIQKLKFTHSLKLI